MSKIEVFAVLLLFTISFLVVASSHGNPIDPCDNYGDCASASIAYTRANPDDSLYLGDQFAISVQTTAGTGSVGCGSGCSESWSGSLSGVSWTYDQSALSGGTSETVTNFVVATNTTGTSTITATALFLVTITTCTSSNNQTTCSTSYAQTSEPVSEQVSLRAFVLTLRTALANATTPLHQIRRNPDGSFFPHDAFYVNYSYSFLFMQQRPDINVLVTPSYDHSILALSSYSNATSNGYFFYEITNKTGTPPVTLTATAFNWLHQPMGIRKISTPLRVIPLAMEFHTLMQNVTDASSRYVLRNPDGSYYRNDSFRICWNASFRFSNFRTDIRINVTSINSQFLRIVNLTLGPRAVGVNLGRSGSFAYVVAGDSLYKPFSVVLRAEAFSFYNNSLALTTSSQPYVVVQYDPAFTSFAYMMYRNSTASSSLQRPWILLVRYDGNLPGYSYGGDENSHPFNGSRTLAERAFFSDFHYATLSYQPYTSNGVFEFHATNSTATLQYDWLNEKDAAPLYSANRIEKYVFNVTASSLSPLLAQEFIYQNVTMIGCWQHENTCDLKQNYWLIPFLWNGRLSIISVDSSGNPVSGTPITLTIQNPSPFDDWLTPDFMRVFGNDSQAIKAFDADLYPTNQTMSFSGNGKLSVWLNQTSLSPPTISITAGGVSLGGIFTFVPAFVNSSIVSVPNSLNGTTFYANATIPIWSYDVIEGSLAYLPISTTIDYPSTFLQLVNSSTWLAGNETAPQTPSAFASQQYGFWPLGGNLTVYVNLQEGGVRLLGTQRVGPNEYRASFYVEPWSGGISSVQLVEGGRVVENESTLNSAAYPSPLPQGLTSLYTLSYSAAGMDTKVVFTNVWGVSTTLDLGTSPIPNLPVDLVPATTASAFGIGIIIWLVVRDILKAREARKNPGQ